MESLRSFEKTVAEWYKGVPHLPVGARAWIAENAWWIVLIALVLTVWGLVVTIPLLLFAFGLSTLFAPSVVGGMYAGFGLGWLAVVLSLVGSVVSAVLLGMAITPLRARARRGWELVALSALLGAALSAIGAVLSFNFGGVIGAAIGAAISGYFLFEVRDLFGSHAKSGVPVFKSDKKDAAKESGKAAADKPTDKKAS